MTQNKRDIDFSISKRAIALVDKFQKGDRLWLRKSKKGRSHLLTNSKRAIALFDLF
ncbi:MULTISPECIES: hypothetical protein [unclassified Microcoleus]|uniref:hypothetical protein n=1 Tax=unclassified Microcoleus TaxID=2642155 RepID=UPI002FD3FEFA